MHFQFIPGTFRIGNIYINALHNGFQTNSGDGTLFMGAI